MKLTKHSDALIIFTIILTTILLIWSTLFLSKLFGQRQQYACMNLQLLENTNDIFQKTNALFNLMKPKNNLKRP